MTNVAAVNTQLTEAQFQRISRLVKDLAGINLHEGKKELVKARLNKRLRAVGLSDFDDYVEFVRADQTGAELVSMLDAISTNLTSFFREPDHFDYLADTLLPRIATRGRRLRIWSAGCSSGEEPYSLAITAREALGDLGGWDAAILATDLSTRVLARAREGVYKADRVAPIEPRIRGKHFEMIQTRPEKIYRVLPAVRHLVHFARLNLMESWPMKGPFDAIFCRNVMIYFDKPTQAQIVGRFHELLAPGGTLFIGHSESLTGVRHAFRYVQPTVYEKT